MAVVWRDEDGIRAVLCEECSARVPHLGMLDAFVRCPEGAGPEEHWH